jgi:hypothetical protein
MILQILSRLSRVRITLGYAALLVGVSAVLVDLGPRVRAQVIAQASTNLHNLAHGNLETSPKPVRSTSGYRAWCVCWHSPS